MRAALTDREITPQTFEGRVAATKKHAAWYAQLAEAMREQGPDGDGPEPRWTEPERYWVDPGDDGLGTEIYHAVRDFATAKNQEPRPSVREVLEFHPPLFHDTVIGTKGHIGPPTQRFLPWTHKCPGVFHVALHHRSQFFKLFAEAAAACGKYGPLFKLAKALIVIGCDNIKTKAMDGLTVPGRRQPCSEDFNGPYSVCFVYNVPLLLRTAFAAGLGGRTDPHERDCAETMLEGWKLMREVHRLMLSLRWEGVADGPAELRTAAGKFFAWFCGVTRDNTHPLLNVSGEQFLRKSQSFHDMYHICQHAEFLWREGKIPIGRTSEQGNEAANKYLEAELGDKGNNHYFGESDNDLWRCMTKLHRRQFQANDDPVRAEQSCSLCRRCTPDCREEDRCTRWPKCVPGHPEFDCPVQLPHKQVGRRCWHCADYSRTAFYADICTDGLDELEVLF